MYVGACGGEPRVVDVVETLERVTVHVETTVSYNATDDCASGVSYELEGALGDRRLFDGPSGEPIETDRLPAAEPGD